MNLEEAGMKNNTEFLEIFPLVCKAIALAMSVAVVVLNMMKAVPMETQVMLLSFGLFGIALAVISKEADHE
jgi:hypothetical protein